MTEIRIPDAGGDCVRGIDMGGYIAPYFVKPPSEIKVMFDKIPDFKFRKDDVMLCTFPKTGTNWSFELIMMLQRRSSERVDVNKLMSMFEAMSADDMEALTSPRLINTHHPPRYFPKDLVTKKIKTVLCVRNPKDTAVSYYNHMHGIKFYDYNGKWENWLPTYVEGKFEYGTYPSYLNEFQDLIEKGPGYPLHVLYFEDLKTNSLEEVNRLATFLEVDIDDKLKQEIVDMCHFDKLATEKQLEPLKGMVFKDHFPFFRKGAFGDWKNWFTEGQNAMFDAAWNKEIRKDTMFNFKYTM